MQEAIGLYEGAKVNINHPKGHPLSPRDYQDRLGVVRGVQFRAGEGLFGDLHFNPRHALSEQLVLDAEHAPQNVGMSHNVLARTTRDGSETVVETITKVQSIDLVADPATTSGLYEHVDGRGSRVESREPENGAARPALDPRLSTLDALTIDELRQRRPELICEIAQEYESQLAQLRRQLDEMTAEEAAGRRREQILQLLQEYDLPLPTKDGVVDSHLVSPKFVETLMQAADEASVRRLIEERAALIRSATRWTNGRSSFDRRPKSRDQLAIVTCAGGRPVRTAAEFAAAVRGA